MDAATLSPIALIDGTALTTLRTPAISAAIADYLAPSHVDHLVVFGSGPQAWGHIEAMRAIRVGGRVTIIARDQSRAASLASRVKARGLNARVGHADDARDAQILVCATTARTPLFDGSLVPDDSFTVAVGSHEADAREVDSALIVRAQLVVEDTAVALREAASSSPSARGDPPRVAGPDARQHHQGHAGRPRAAACLQELRHVVGRPCHCRRGVPRPLTVGTHAGSTCALTRRSARSVIVRSRAGGRAR